MSAEPLPTIGQSILDDIEAFSFQTALSRLADPTDGGALSPVLAGLLRTRAQIGLEKWRTAYDTLQQVKGMGDLATAERLEAQVMTARVLRIGWWSTDYALDLALAAAQQATRTNAVSLAIDAHLEAAILFGRKRCRDLSRKQLAAAAAVGAHAARVHATTGDLAITFDERPAAKDSFAAAIERATAEAEARARAEGERLGRIGLAKLHTVLGEFDSAAEHLAALGDRPHGDIGAKRIAWRLYAAKADWSHSARVLGEIVDASPEGDPARGLMLERASALYRAGDIDGARAAWTKISASGGGDWAARIAARALDRIGSGRTRRARLQAFPSVTQLRNHCGPASVELCMRFFGTTAEQVAVAREIKHPDGGTPVHRMRRYMDAAGFHTRRIEAGLDRLKAILDAGIPVIIEEDYSTSRHVAVAVGYDDRREILEVQDPMTHEVRETGYDELAKLRDFSNHGALVAVPAARADLIARLDEAGAVECEYITKTDQAWEAHEQKREEDAERLLAEAIALHEAYELAWVLRFVRARGRRDQDPNEENDRALSEVLDRILALWPDDEWPQQFLGRVRDVQGRTGDALAAFERARDRDPDDANNWCSIGDCKLALGDRKGAREAFENALRRDPAHTRSNENLADMAFDDGDTSLASLLNECALELAPDNAFNWHVRGRVLGRAEQLTDAIAAYHRALELRPGSPGFTVERARLLGRAGQVAEAVSSLEALRDQRPGDTWVLMSLADVAYNHDQLDACLAACATFREADAESATPLAIAGAAKCKRGELEAGLVDLKAALSRRPTYAWAHREMAKGLAGAGRWDEAILASAASLGVTGSAESQWVLGDVLARAGHRQDGAGYLRRAARSGALTDAQLERVAEVIGDLEGAGAVHSFFGSLAEEHPREVAITRAHSRYLLERIWAPGAAVAVLSRLSEMSPQDPCVLANEADDLMSASLDDEARGEVLFEQAIAAAPKLITPRRFFARHLNQRGRFAQALEVLEPCPASAETLADRVHALLGLRRDTDAQAAIDAWCETLAPEVRDARRRPLAYRIAHANRRWDEALELATALAADSGELDDDGKLGRWEDARFECLVALGRSDEAGAFGCTQCGSPREWGQLAYGALAQGDLALARDFATTCHEQDPNEGYGLTVLARLADHDGDVAKATALWQRMKEVSSWHVHDENLGRLALAAGELERARTCIEAAVSTGHTCPVALQLRAELKLREGDRTGALADAERARACLQLERRDVSEDLDGLIAGLHGRLEEARGLFERWTAREKLAASDVAGHRAVAAALGL
jgi:tetratricopeptide (TPR) repeat protein